MRKGQGLPTNAIILVVLGLIVLVVLVAIFTGKIRIFSLNVTDYCGERGGTCMNQMSNGQCGGDKPIKIWAKGCGCVVEGDSKQCEGKKEDNIGQCCLPIGSAEGKKDEPKEGGPVTGTA